MAFVNSFVITRAQARTGCTARVAAIPLAGEPAAVTARIPAGVRNGTRIRLPKQALPTDRAWPQEVLLRVRVPCWWRRNGLVALFIMAGLVAGAGRYAALLAVVWAVAAFCAGYGRVHAADRFDPLAAKRFWLMFRGACARTALLYLVPFGAAVAFAPSVAFVISRVKVALTIRQMVSAQNAMSAVSVSFSKWIRLNAWLLFLILLGVYLVSCLLLAAAGEIRYRVAAWLRRIAEVHGRYSGPAAVTLATLASFTFLVSVAAPLGTQFRLQAVEDTRDYRYAARAVLTELDNQAAAALAAGILAALPAGYRHVWSAAPLQQQVAAIRHQETLLPVPLSQSEPDAARVVASEEALIHRTRDLPAQSVVHADPAPDPAAAPGDVTGGQAAAGRDWARSSPAGVVLLDDDGKDVVLQAGTVVSGPVWDKVKELVKGRFPLAAPIVDVLSAAFGDQLQETLYQQVTPLVRQVMGGSGRARASIAATARRIVATVNVSALVRGHVADAARFAAERQAAVADLTDTATGLQHQVQLVGGLIASADAAGFEAARYQVTVANASVQKGVVSQLMGTIQASDDDLMRLMTAYDVTGDPAVLRMNAARAIRHLSPDLPKTITGADLAVAEAHCGCL
jgi:hypothetical protein